MLPVARELLYAGENCKQLCAQIRGLDVGTVVIGTAYSAFYSRLAGIVSEFHKQYPGIQVQLCGGYSTQLLNQLNEHTLDLCIISKREGAHNWLPVMEDEMMAWVPANHTLSKLSAIPVTVFEKEPYIETYPGQDIDNSRVFEKNKIKPNLQFSTMDSLATYSMVEAGLGISMNNAINGRSWSGSVQILPLVPEQKVEIGVASLPNLSPVVNTFYLFMKSHIAV